MNVDIFNHFKNTTSYLTRIKIIQRNNYSGETQDRSYYKKTDKTLRRY